MRLIGVRDLCFFRRSDDMLAQRILTGQVEAFNRFIPLTTAANLVCAGIVAATLAPEVGRSTVAIWLVAIALICALRSFIAHAHRAKHLCETGIWICASVAMLAAAWVVPFVWWVPNIGLEHQILITALLLGMTSASMLVLSPVPPAAFGYIVIFTGGIAKIAYDMALPALALLSLLFGAVLCWTAFWSARQFISHLRLGAELAEKAELISLLREFDASGSEWLWKLDAELRITYVSDALAAAAGVTSGWLRGKSVMSLLKPRGGSSGGESSNRILLDRLTQGEEFRDVPVLAREGTRWWSFSGQPILGPTGDVTGWRGVGSDVTELRLEGQDSFSTSRRDPLTGLGNRLLVREEIEQRVARRSKECSVSLLLIDLDRFKLVNDTLGHAVGDELLRMVAARLKAVVGTSGCVCRLGGDEFAIVWDGPSSTEVLSRLAATVIAELSLPFTINDSPLQIGATVGVTTLCDAAATHSDVLTRADLALYRAKEHRRGTIEFFVPEMAEEAAALRQLESDVREAVMHGRFTLVYQPIVDAGTLEVVGREALLRWNDPRHGRTSPAIFVPIIESAGLMGQVGDWIIRQACAQAARWGPDERLSVNVSVTQFAGGRLLNTVAGALASSGLPPSRLELEITESLFLKEDEYTLSVLESLAGLGVKLSIDDFGQGYSSFGYLQRALFSKIKIDQSFVRGASLGERHSIAIVRGIVALARELNMETTAEGVETPSQVQLMRDLGCSQLQGFACGMPESMSPENLSRDDELAGRPTLRASPMARALPVRHKQRRRRGTQP